MPPCTPQYISSGLYTPQYVLSYLHSTKCIIHPASMHSTMSFTLPLHLCTPQYISSGLCTTQYNSSCLHALHNAFHPVSALHHIFHPFSARHNMYIHPSSMHSTIYFILSLHSKICIIDPAFIHSQCLSSWFYTIHYSSCLHALHNVFYPVSASLHSTIYFILSLHSTI